MKTDLALPMDEYLDPYCVVPKRVSAAGAPGARARHISITAEDKGDTQTGAHGCRCDRWGHPCPGCLERKPQTRTASPDLSSTKQMSKQKWST
jgi:hypothetical protein